MISVTAIAQEKTTAKSTEKPAVKEEAKTGKTKGRLPPYYKDVVDEKQKAEIYKVQVSYEEKIDDLKIQLEKLESDRDAAVEKVLTAEQKEKVNLAREAASGKKKTKAAEKKETEKKTVATEKK